MEDIINVLLEGKLENLNGFQIIGEIRIPKKTIAQSITDSTIETTDEEDEDSLFSAQHYRSLLEYVDINEANIYFEKEAVCIKLNIQK